MIGDVGLIQHQPDAGVTHQFLAGHGHHVSGIGVARQFLVKKPALAEGLEKLAFLFPAFVPDAGGSCGTW